jgi:HEAT repeat protein
MIPSKRIWKIVGVVLLLSIFAVLPAAAGSLSEKTATAFDRTQTPEDRMKAISDLGASGDESAASTLIKILRDKSEEQRIRTSAVLALADLKTPRAPIIRAFEAVYGESKAGKNLRYALLLSLGRIKASESLTLLSRALSNSDSMVRMKAFQALGALEDDNALALAARRLKTEDDYMVRAAAVRAVAHSRSARAEAILTKALRSDPAPLVRHNAILMLSKFETLGKDARAALEAAKEDESTVVRNTARGVLP